MKPVTVNERMFDTNTLHMACFERISYQRMLQHVAHVHCQPTMIQQDIGHVIHQIFNASYCHAIHSRYFIGNKILSLESRKAETATLCIS